MKNAITIMAIGLFLATNVAHAAAPQLIPVQGVLKDAEGVPVHGSVTVVFSIYTFETGGTALWTETQDVLVVNGLFTVYLGDVTTLDLATFRDNSDLYLGIQVGSDAEMERMYLGSNPFAGYAEYCGNIPAVDFSDLTGTVDASVLPAGVVVGALSCTGTDKVSGVDSSGGLVCSADQDTSTSYSAGSGLTLSGTTFSVDTSAIQRRVSGVCASGSSISQINPDGTVVCEPDDGMIYYAGSGLDLSGSTFIVDPTDFNGANPAATNYTTGDFGSTGSTNVTLRTTTITVPGPGMVVAMARAETYCDAGCTAIGEFVGGLMTITATATDDAATGSYAFFYAGVNQSTTVTVFETFVASTAGTYDVYLRGRREPSVGVGTEVGFYRPHLQLMFIPN